MVMTERSDILQSISDTIADYRRDEISPRTPRLIDDWLQQFPEAVQFSLLNALDYVLERTYISRAKFQVFLKALALSTKFAPTVEPKDYWRRANFVNIQQGGSSQAEILELFDEVLEEAYGFGLSQTGSPDGDFIYLDDCIGTGARLRSDVCNWLTGDTPQNINLHVITPIFFKGSYWIDAKIQETGKENGKTVLLKKWSLPQFEMENRRMYRNQSDVLWPTSDLEHDDVHEYFAYLGELGRPPTLRHQIPSGSSRIFANDSQRVLMENAFLTRGCTIRKKNDNLPKALRPLGYSILDTLGFGSMFVTYRNCPNNCPLVLWVDQPNYPALFPRKTNTDSLIERFLRG